MHDFRGIPILLTVAMSLLVELSCGNPPQRIRDFGSSENAILSENQQGQDASFVGASPLRRLTNYEYRNTLTAMFGDISALTLTFTQEGTSSSYPFANRATDQAVSTSVAQEFFNAAEIIAAAATTQAAMKSKIIACDVNLLESCASPSLKRLATTAFRREPTAAQLESLLVIWRAGNTGGTFYTGMEWSIAALLQMPDFLYRIETGTDPSEVDSRIVKLSSWDMASRLSYFLWNMPPDAILLNEAAADRLKTSEQVSAQVERMIKTDAAKKMVSHFHDEWLGLLNIEAMQKDLNTFPTYSKAVAVAMREEVRLFVGDVIWNGSGKIEDLFSSRYTFLNKTLGDFYGVSGLGADFVKIDETKLGGRPAAGLLTMGGMLAMHDSSAETSPTKRGILVRTGMFCQVPGAPPPNTPTVLPPQTASQTRRQAVAAHSTNASCAGCHLLFDPIGLSLENFDAAGRFRSTENKMPIDVTGSLIATDVNGSYNGPAELGAKIGKSESVVSCIAYHWFQFAFGRDPVKSDDEMLAKLKSIFINDGYVAGIKYITQTPQFQYRTLSEGDQL